MVGFTMCSMFAFWMDSCEPLSLLITLSAVIKWSVPPRVGCDAGNMFVVTKTESPQYSRRKHVKHGLPARYCTSYGSQWIVIYLCFSEKYIHVGICTQRCLNCSRNKGGSAVLPLQLNRQHFVSTDVFRRSWRHRVHTNISYAVFVKTVRYALSVRVGVLAVKEEAI